MKLVPAVKYNVQDVVTKTIPIFYGFFVFMALLLFIASKVPSWDVEGSFSGISINSSILLIVVGLIFTRPTFRFLTQMGVSHKTQIAAKIIGVVLISAVVVLADRLANVIFTYLFKASSITFESSDPSYMPFNDTLSGLGPVAREMIKIGLEFMNRVMFFAGAVLVAMLYARMSAFVKVTVTIGVPVLLIFGLAVLVDFVPEQIKNMFDTLGKITGLSNGKPINNILCMVVVTVIFFGLLYLAMRRAPVKD